MWRVFISFKNIQSVYIIVSPRGRRSSGARLLRRVAYLFRRVINYVIRRRRRRRFFLLFSSTFRPKGNCYQNTEYRLSLLVVRKFSRPDIFVERKLWHVENANRFSLREREAEHPVTSQCASRDRGEWDWVYYSSNKLLYLICRKVYGATDDTSSSWLNGKLFSFFFFFEKSLPPFSWLWFDRSSPTAPAIIIEIVNEQTR